MHEMLLQVLHLKIGAPIIFTKNIDENLVNGQLGIVKEISTNKIGVQLKTTKREVDIARTTFRE